MDFLGAGTRKARKKALREREEVAVGERLLAEGRAEEAERLLGGILRGREEAYGGEDLRTVAVRAVYASALFDLGRGREAAGVYATLVGDYLRMYSENSVHLLVPTLWQCDALLLDGQYLEAEALARGAVAHFDRSVYSHPTFLRRRFNGRTRIGMAIAAGGRHAEALAHFTEQASDAARALGDSDDMTLAARIHRVPELHFLDRTDEARRAAAALVTATALRGGSLAAAAASAQLQVLCPADVVPAARRVVAGYEGEGAQAKYVHAGKARLAAALSKLGRYEEALAVLDTVPTPAPAARPVWALTRAEVLHAAGRPDAPPAAREAVDACAAVWAPTHYGVLVSRTLLADVCGTQADRTAVADDWEAHFGAAHRKSVAARKAAGG